MISKKRHLANVLSINPILPCIFSFYVSPNRQQHWAVARRHEGWGGGLWFVIHCYVKEALVGCNVYELRYNITLDRLDVACLFKFYPSSLFFLRVETQRRIQRGAKEGLDPVRF